MKKIAILCGTLAVCPVLANEYSGTYGYDTTPSVIAPRRDNYIGFRIHKNENLAIKHDVIGGDEINLRKDNFGIGLNIGNRLSNNVKIEFETSYTGATQSKYATTVDVNVWANMFNVYLFQEFSGAISPYAGIGLGFAGLWGDIDTPLYHIMDRAFDLSYQIIFGVNFALNDRIDFNMGAKYQYYGDLEHKLHGAEFATTDISGTEIYFGAAYKFGLD